MSHWLITDFPHPIAIAIARGLARGGIVQPDALYLAGTFSSATTARVLTHLTYTQLIEQTRLAGWLRYHSRRLQGILCCTASTLALLDNLLTERIPVLAILPVWEQFFHSVRPDGEFNMNSRLQQRTVLWIPGWTGEEEFLALATRQWQGPVSELARILSQADCQDGTWIVPEPSQGFTGVYLQDLLTLVEQWIPAPWTSSLAGKEFYVPATCALTSSAVKQVVEKAIHLMQETCQWSETSPHAGQSSQVQTTIQHRMPCEPPSSVHERLPLPAFTAPHFIALQMLWWCQRQGKTFFHLPEKAQECVPDPVDKRIR